jgi:hypothetical protein
MSPFDWHIAHWGKEIKMAEGGEVETPKKKWSLLEWAKNAAMGQQPESQVLKEEAPNKITWGNLEQVASKAPDMLPAGESSNVEEVGFDPDDKALEVKFKSGAVYRYEGATQADFERMQKAHPGKYVHSNLKAKPFGRVE